MAPNLDSGTTYSHITNIASSYLFRVGWSKPTHQDTTSFAFELPPKKKKKVLHTKFSKEILYMHTYGQYKNMIGNRRRHVYRFVDEILCHPCQKRLVKNDIYCSLMRWCYGMHHNPAASCKELPNESLGIIFKLIT